MFATIIQKWNAFKADWNEYQRLRRVAARAWRKLYNIRGKITVICGNDGRANEARCIRRELVNMRPLNMMDDWGSNRVSSVIPFDSYCPHFKGERPDEEIASCTETSCPHYANNCEYVDAAKEYENAAARCRAFWGSKPKTK